MQLRQAPHHVSVGSRRRRVATTSACTRPRSHHVRNSYLIRPVEGADVAKLAEIEQECKEVSAGWSMADIEAELSNALSCTAVAADSSTNTPLGYIVCWLVAGELQVRPPCIAAVSQCNACQPNWAS